MSRVRQPIGLILFVLIVALPSAVAALQGAAREEHEIGAGEPGGLVLESRPLGGIRADVAGLLLAGGDIGSLSVAALAVGRCPEGDRERDWRPGVDLWFEVDGARLFDESIMSPPPESLRVELYAYAVTADGEIAASSSRWVRLRLEDLEPNLPASGVKFAAHLELQPGEYQIRMLVREVRSQRFVLRILTVTVPGPEPSTPFLAPPLFPDLDRTWVRVRDLDTPARVPELSGPKTGFRGPPAAFPVLLAGREQAVWLQGCGFGGESITLRLLDGDRQPVAEPALEMMPQDDVGARALVEARLEIPEVPPGIYLLQSSVAVAEETLATLTPVYVIDPALEALALSWAAVRQLALDPGQRQQTFELAEERRGRKQIAAVAAAYREVLERLATGDRQEAISQLRQLSRAVVDPDGDRARGRRWLLEGQEEVATRLAKREPESLLPLLLLHLETHYQYLEEGVVDPFLLGASEDHILLLARSYASEAESEVATVLAAEALSELGAALQRTRNRLAARRVLEEAVALDEGNSAALLELAHLFERQGLHQEAATTLRKLLDLVPQSEEGRLRLAMNLRRLGEVAQADRLLRSVLADGSSSWLLTVAYEELARILVERGRFDEAARLLESGISRLPFEQRLYVQLAYALDRGGRRQVGDAVLERIPEVRSEMSPRLLYSRRARGEGGEARTSLLRHGTARLPLLSQALAEVEESG